MRVFRLGLHRLGEFETVHSRHFDVEQDNVGRLILEYLQCVDAILRRDDVESFALKLAGFYAPALVPPPFILTGDPGAVSGSIGNAIPIRFTARDAGKAAPGSVIEFEIWDSSDKSVYKEHKSSENYAAGEVKPYTFKWTPTKPGTYTVTLSAYGPRWTPSYAFKPKAIAITVN